QNKVTLLFCCDKIQACFVWEFQLNILNIIPMKIISFFTVLISFGLSSASLSAQSTTAYTVQDKNSKSSVHTQVSNRLYPDKHVLGPRKVNLKEDAEVHAGDLAAAAYI